MTKKYYKHKIENLIIINKIITIHYFEFEKNFKTSGETHDFWELVYADKGNIICCADDRNIVLKQGEILFHKPNEFHTLSADRLSAPNVFIISFDCKSEAIRFFENKKLTLNKDYVKYIYSIIKEAKNTFNIPYSKPDMRKLELLKKPTLGGQQLIKNYLETLLISIMRNETQKENSNEIFITRDELESKIANQVVEILKRNVDNNLKISDICAELNYNKSYIFKQFKSVTNCTVFDYFRKLKIEKAKRLLREGNLNVAQISNELSFDTPNYFTKTFKKITTLTPTQYKKRSLL